ncbi:MAG: adenylyl-sulfate kinase [Acidobacteriota bacterium]
MSDAGLCVWLTGLSGAGKSSIANALAATMRDAGREVTVLDGDAVRATLSKGLGFGKADRDLNVARIGFVAREIVRHGGLVVCATISPYRAARDAVRAAIPIGHFVEVFVDTPLAICEQRDAKGLYARARRGELRHVTGLDDPYEPPLDAELTLTSGSETAADHAIRLVAFLTAQGVVCAGDPM